MFEFRIEEMPLEVSNVFLIDIVGKSIREVYSVLVCNRHCNPQQVGELVGQVEFFALFRRLLSVGTSNNTRNLAGFFGKDCHVCQRREISYPDRSDPAVYDSLRLTQPYVGVCMSHINCKNKENPR